MKKIYVAPKVDKLSLAPELMSGLRPGSIGTQGTTTNDDTGTGSWGNGGNGGSGIIPEAKGNGRGFWDDEE